MLAKLREIIANISKKATIDEKFTKEIIKEFQKILIQSDVNVKLAFEISKKLEAKINEPIPAGFSRKEHIITALYDEILEILKSEEYTPRLEKHKILLVGLYGSGKTSATAKIAKFYSKRGFKTGIITTDIYRPAAYEQAVQLANQINVKVLGSGKDPFEILNKGLEEGKNLDILIVDSAGRDSLNEELLEELMKIKEILKPEETFLVISADIGQTASKQAKAFSKIGLTGVIVTKTDTSGKAGGAISACAEAKIPICFLSTGEKPDDFEVFNAKKFVGRLLGFPDLESLLAKVKEAAEESEFNPEDILSGEYNLKTFMKQIEATRKMGPLKKVLEMLGLNIGSEFADIGEKKLETYKVILQSMTKKELENPEIIDSSRIKRIAKGSGKSEAEVRELLKQFNASKKIISQFKKGKIKGIKSLMKGMPWMKMN
ncbi:MAG: signal recognition particle receptor subunit alpha [archaeon]